jgi:hypothetical protein
MQVIVKAQIRIVENTHLKPGTGNRISADTGPFGSKQPPAPPLRSVQSSGTRHRESGTDSPLAPPVDVAAIAERARWQAFAQPRRHPRLPLRLVSIDLGTTPPTWSGRVRPEESSSASLARACRCRLSPRTFARSASPWKPVVKYISWLARSTAGHEVRLMPALHYWCGS